MNTIKYHKLVRDKIPELIEKEGKQSVCSVLSDEEYLEDKSMEELADLLEVMMAVAKARGSSIEEVERIRQQKADKRGGFEKKILLEEVRTV